jgi:hypothetical protein
MTILYILIGFLVVIIILLSLALYQFSKKYLTNYDKKLILFVIDMYLLYGESNNIFPNDDAKKILIERIIIVKNKIENDTNNRKINKKKQS